ncbi:MAG: leucine-rich repeat domain-containing protein [Lachnospiraceae bacterium]
MRKILVEKTEIDPRTCSYGFPWRYDATCYNFHGPEETVLDREIETLKDKTEIETLVIGCDLENYNFIADMTNLRQLYIYSGNQLNDISFVKNLVDLRQLYIAQSQIDSLDGLVQLITEQKKRFDAETDLMKRLFIGIDAVCIESACKNLDGKVLLEPGLRLSEVIINGRHLCR